MNLVKAKSEETINLVFKKSRLKLKPGNLAYSNLYGDP